MTMSKQRLDAIMAHHLQAEIPWRPSQFVVPEITEDDWLTDEEEVWAMVAVYVVDRFFKRSITSTSRGK